MVRTIAIATLLSYNCGNRLQNHALSVILRGLSGADTQTLLPARTQTVQRIKTMIKRALCQWAPSKKWACFARFDSKNVRFARQKLNDKELAAAYDVFVIGSDQVWNPDFSFTSEAEYLPQVPKNRKIAYAASFGVSEIAEDKERTAQLLNDIAFISVRETAGAKIVYKLTGRNVPVVLDPTMLLEASYWTSIERKPYLEIPASGYCLKYVLGDDVNSRRIENLAFSKKLTVIDLTDESLPVGPAEFVWLIHHASLVCTDSFHATAFSILFEKPFVIFERQSQDEDMSSRFDTLCATFNLNSHRIDKPAFSEESVFSEDWRSIKSRLDEERRCSLSYLETALRSIGHGD